MRPGFATRCGTYRLAFVEPRSGGPGSRHVHEIGDGDAEFIREGVQGRQCGIADTAFDVLVVAQSNCPDFLLGFPR